jgi:hypothetical protein
MQTVFDKVSSYRSSQIEKYKKSGDKLLLYSVEKIDLKSHDDSFVQYCSIISAEKQLKLIDETYSEPLLHDEEFISSVEFNTSIESLNKYRELFYELPEGNLEYDNFMSKAIDDAFSTDKRLHYMLMNMLREDKSRIFGNNTTRVKKSVEKNNPFNSRFKLIPISEFFDEKTILKKILTAYSIDVKANSWKSVASACSCVIRCLYKMINQPHVYELSKVNSLHTDDSAVLGCSNNTVERFSCITQQENTDWNFSIETHGSSDNSVVCETFDGVHWRFLAPWPNYAIKIPNSFLHVLINYSLINSIAEKYQAAVFSASHNNFYLGKKLAMESFTSAYTDVEVGILRDKIVKGINEYIVREFHKTPKNNLEVNEVIHADDLREHFESVVCGLFKQGSNDAMLDFNGGDFAFGEVLSSFISTLQVLSRRFMRELHTRYNANPLTNDDFDGDIRMLILKKIEGICVEILELLLPVEENVFTSTQMKYLIMNFQ